MESRGLINIMAVSSHPSRQFASHRGNGFTVLVLSGLGLVALLANVGCGGGGGTPVVPAIQLTPLSKTVGLNGVQQFTAVVSGITPATVSWNVAEAGGGTVTAAGLYTAPATAGTYHLTATSTVSAALTASATITVPVAVNVSPQAQTVTLGQSVQFSATVLGSPNAAVTWTIKEGAIGGTISASGLYVAGSTRGTYTVQAVSSADPTQAATASVTVQAGTASGTIQ